VCTCNGSCDLRASLVLLVKVSPLCLYDCERVGPPNTGESSLEAITEAIAVRLGFSP
jgi:hypothetical protein